MRFMIIVKATKDSEAGVMPEEKLMAEMATYHEELAKAGVLLDANGLQPSAKGWCVKFSGGKRTVVDGPFTEAKELIAGYTLIQAKSREEALEWGGTAIGLCKPPRRIQSARQSRRACGDCRRKNHRSGRARRPDDVLTQPVGLGRPDHRAVGGAGLVFSSPWGPRDRCAAFYDNDNHSAGASNTRRSRRRRR
jgi:hypothetical protein